MGLTDNQTCIRKMRELMQLIRTEMAREEDVSEKIDEGGAEIEAPDEQ